ncbi:hypothetical protein [Enterococcus durans]|uniref:hypothetical protein n=2 Tax=Enterococcus durans TaxID=53345 RepID=UPI0039A54C9D
MEIDSYLNPNIHLIIFCVLLFLNFFLAILRGRRNKTRIDEQNALLKERYPDLSDKDLKYRQECIRTYFKIYFTGYSNFKLVIFLTLLLFITVGVGIGLIISDNFIGEYISLGLLFIYISVIALSTPKPDKEHAFWMDYLETHPDNPLMVILRPLETMNKVVRSVRLLGILNLICGLYAFFIAYLISYLYF